MDEQEQQQYEKQIGVEPNQEKQTLAPIEAQQTPTPPSHTKLIVGIVVAVLIVAGAVGAYFFVNQRSVIEPAVVSEEASEFDDWKTYRNEEFGFEVMYPVLGIEQKIETDINYENTPRIFLMSKSSPSEIFRSFAAFYIIDNPEGLSGESRFNPDGHPCTKTLVETNYYYTELINGYEIFRSSRGPLPHEYNGNDCGPVGYFIQISSPDRSKIVMLTYPYQTVGHSDFGFETYEELYDMHNKMLSTFKFFNQTDTSTWKTYRNDKYEFKYPAILMVNDEEEGFLSLIGQVTPTISTNPAVMGGLCKIIISSNDNSELLSLPAWVEQVRQNSGSPLPISSEPVTISGLEGVREVSDEMGLTTEAYVATNSNAVTAFQLLCGDEAYREGEVIFTSILSSFKFIDSN